MPSIVKLTLESNQYEQNLKKAQRSWNDFMRGIGISPSKFTAVAAAISAVTTALKVAKDAFMQSETNVDEWGRTVRSAEGIYQSFLQSLNSGDFSGFLNNIGQVTQAARDAYNALDELSTRMTIINPERAKLQAQQQQYRATIRRYGADSAEGRAATAALKALEPQLSKSFQKESSMNYNAFEKLVRERLAIGGINLNQKSFQQFMKTFSNDDAYQRLRNNARGSISAQAINLGQGTGRGYVGTTTVDTRNIEQKLMDLFTDEWRKANSGYLTASFNARGASYSNMLGNSRYLKAGGGGRGGTSGGGGGAADIYAADSITAQIRLVAELRKQWEDASAELRDGYKKQLNEAEIKLEIMQGRRGVLKASDIKTTGLGNLMGMPGKGGKMMLDDKAMKIVSKQIADSLGVSTKTQSIGQTMGELSSGVSSIVGGIQQLGIEIPEGLTRVVGSLQVITSILVGIEALIEVGNFLDIFHAGGVVHAANGFAGTVPGSRYSGDHIPILANAGEVVLTRAMAGNLASQLNGNVFGDLNLTATIRGEQLKLALNNNGRRTGRGEYVQSTKRG